MQVFSCGNGKFRFKKKNGTMSKCFTEKQLPHFIKQSRAPPRRRRKIVQTVNVRVGGRGCRRESKQKPKPKSRKQPPARPAPPPAQLVALKQLKAANSANRKLLAQMKRKRSATIKKQPQMYHQSLRYRPAPPEAIKIPVMAPQHVPPIIVESTGAKGLKRTLSQIRAIRVERFRLETKQGKGGKHDAKGKRTSGGLPLTTGNPLAKGQLDRAKNSKERAGNDTEEKQAKNNRKQPGTGQGNSQRNNDQGKQPGKGQGNSQTNNNQGKKPASNNDQGKQPGKGQGNSQTNNDQGNQPGKGQGNSQTNNNQGKKSVYSERVNSFVAKAQANNDQGKQPRKSQGNSQTNDNQGKKPVSNNDQGKQPGKGQGNSQTNKNQGKKQVNQSGIGQEANKLENLDEDELLINIYKTIGDLTKLTTDLYTDNNIVAANDNEEAKVIHQGNQSNPIDLTCPAKKPQDTKSAVVIAKDNIEAGQLLRITQNEDDSIVAATDKKEANVIHQDAGNEDENVVEAGEVLITGKEDPDPLRREGNTPGQSDIKSQKKNDLNDLRRNLFDTVKPELRTVYESPGKKNKSPQ